MTLTQKTIMSLLAAMAFLGAATMTFAQTATTTPSPTPTTTQSMPAGAPNTGLGGDM